MKKIIILVIAIVCIVFLIYFLNKKESTPSVVSEEKITDSVLMDEELSPFMNDAPEPGSFFKIDEDFEQVHITIDQMYAYKLVTMFDTSQLKEKYQADSQPRLQGDTLLMTIQSNLENLTPEMQTMLEPMFLSFTDPNSFFYHKNIELRTQILSQLALF